MWVKICGIRDVATAEQVAALRPDAVGLNFYGKSPRCVTLETARDIVRRLPPSISTVGVFVNHPVDDIARLVDSCRLTMVQLHGDETPEFVASLQAQLPDTPMLRAWRMGDRLDDLAIYLDECQRRKVRLAGCLIDAKVSGTYGGSGHCPPWESLSAHYRRTEWPPLILAGGLTPDNVASGIAAVSPWGVDVASGVESSPGVKDVSAVLRFLHAARQLPL